MTEKQQQTRKGAARPKIKLIISRISDYIYPIQLRKFQKGHTKSATDRCIIVQ